MLVSWLRIWYADCTEGSRTNRVDTTVTIPAWTYMIVDAMPYRLVRWKTGGRYPALATASRPVVGPATHAVTLPSTPTASMIAMTGPAHGIPAHRSTSSKVTRIAWVRLMSCCGTIQATASAPSTKIKTVVIAEMMIAIG